MAQEVLAGKDFKLVINIDGPTVTTGGKTIFRVDIYEIAARDRICIHVHVPAVATRVS